jgi:hypothetical protein
VMIKDDHGNTFMEIPLSVATLGVIAAPVLAAVGAVVTLISQFTVVVERADQENESAGVQKTEPESTGVSGSGDRPPEDEATTEGEWESEGGASK